MPTTICVCGGLRQGNTCNRCGDIPKPKPLRDIDRDNPYSKNNWIKLSIRFREQWPLCAHCEREGVTTVITSGDGKGCVDHIIRVNGQDDPAFWVDANMQGLCIRHHSIKTQLETSGEYTEAMIREDQKQRAQQLKDYRVNYD